MCKIINSTKMLRKPRLFVRLTVGLDLFKHCSIYSFLFNECLYLMFVWDYPELNMFRLAEWHLRRYIETYQMGRKKMMKMNWTE